MRRDPTYNQSEHGTPQSSVTGLAFYESADELLGAPTYLPYTPVGIPGRFGEAGNVDSVGTPLVVQRGYAGLAPMELQPEVVPPDPWTVRARGL